MKAPIADTIATFKSSAPYLKYFTVAKVVPHELENLLHPYTKCIGIPVAIYAGIEIKPPPPATESTNPAKNINGHKKNK